VRVGTQEASHSLQGGNSVGEEHQAELAEGRIEGPSAERQGLSIGGDELQPFSRGFRASNEEHRQREVDPDDGAERAQPCPSQKSGVPSARGKIEDAVTGLYASRV
jgi:hypothetical protein